MTPHPADPAPGEVGLTARYVQHRLDELQARLHAALAPVAKELRERAGDSPALQCVRTAVQKCSREVAQAVKT